MTYNLPLLRKERDWAAEQLAKPTNKSELYMNQWRMTWGLDWRECGTTYCIAGHVAEAAPGVVWLDDSDVTDGQTRRDVEEFAQERLGLNDFETHRLFYASEKEVLGILDELIAAAEAEERSEV